MPRATKKMQPKSHSAKRSASQTANITQASKQPTGIESPIIEEANLEADVNRLKLEVKKMEHLAAEERIRLDEICQSLLSQLHSTQEQLEAIWNEHERVNIEREQFRELFFYTLSKNSDFWLYKTISVELTPTKSRIEIDIHLKDTYINDERFDETKFRLAIDNGTAGLIFQAAKPGEPTMIKKWPREQLSTQELCCMPAQGSSFENANATLMSLGTTDWLRVKDLFKKLGHFFENNLDTIPLSDEITIQISRALNNTNTILDNWPKILRYDQVSLEDSTDFDNYNALNICLHNALIGNKVIERFPYTMATTYTSEELTQEHPRLEFSELCQHLIENWYAETQDDRGARLELRFAHPNALDIDVWHKLSERDQILVATILSGAERQLSELEITPELSNLDTAAWHEVARTMRKALGDYTLQSRIKNGHRT
ncbi:hypothetical protein ACF8GB_20155 [Pseudomonas sp. xss_4]|uniref:hypothetical protein n=1 Tax=Pseudomonas sp. xss_4 TaxID=3367216 RepID=UPI00370A7706